MKKLIALTLTLVMLFTVSLAFAMTLEPINTEIEGLAGATINATVGEYNEDTRTFLVTLYDDDRYEIDKVEKLAVGDTLLAGGRLHTVKETKETEDGEIMIVCEDGDEIVFVQVGDDQFIAESTSDNRRYMHAFAELHLPAAEGIVYEDNSNPDLEAKPVLAEGLEAVLKAKAEKEETSNGFDFYATVITLNGKLEIERIHQDYDVAQ